jgi:hypothetical protein
MLPSKSDLSIYNLDTLAIFCGSKDYKNFAEEYNLVDNGQLTPIHELLQEMEEITRFTTHSIARKSLTDFKFTIPRTEINSKLESFLNSGYSLLPLIAPGGYGKSIALAHWVNELDRKKNICCFCQAPFFYSLVSVKSISNQKLLLNPGVPNSFYKLFMKKFKGSRKKLVLIIDAFDELGLDSTKIGKLTNIITEILLSYHNKGFLKIVLSLRETIWSSQRSAFNKIIEKGYIVKNKKNTESGYINLPRLLPQEVKKIIENHRNELDQPVIYDCISFEFRESIKIPIYLHFFLNLSKTRKNLSEITPGKLEHEYLRDMVIESKYAEQKEDLLWKIIELIELRENGYRARKNSVKEAYPVHLKRESDYYHAYIELLQGILVEDRIENKFGLFSTWVTFRHLDFYYYLSALYLINKRNGLDTGIFQEIISSDHSDEWKSYLTAYIFQIAWEKENLDVLMEFCKVPNTFLESLPVRFAVGSSFRQITSIRNQIIQEYSKIPSFRTYYFEQFVDTNYIFNNYKLRIKAYLENKKTREALLFGNTILFLGGFLEMNRNECIQYFRIIESIDPGPDIHPWPLGRKLASGILMDAFINNKKPGNSKKLVNYYQEIAYSYEGYFAQGVVAFELPVIVSLFLTKQLDVMAEFLKRSIDAYSLSNPPDDYYELLCNIHNSLLIVFYDYACMKQGKGNSSELAIHIEEKINHFSTSYDDFQYLLLLHLLLMDIYTETDQI